MSTLRKQSRFTNFKHAWNIVSENYWLTIKPNDSVAPGAPYICQYRMIHVRYAHGARSAIKMMLRRKKELKRQERNKLIRVSS